jgi:hypothetical protein
MGTLYFFSNFFDRPDKKIFLFRYLEKKFGTVVRPFDQKCLPGQGPSRAKTKN